MTVDPLVLMTEVERATERLLRTAATLDDAAMAAPSRLPGWSRGHVLTHVARNADAYTNLLNWARTGEETPAYPTPTARAEGIEAGAGRPATEQRADIRAAHERFTDAAAAMPATAWTFFLPPTGAPAAAVPWARLREVEVHHVDLGAGYTPDDWSEAFALRLLREIAAGPAADGTPLVLRPDGVEHPLHVGGPAGATGTGGSETGTGATGTGGSETGTGATEIAGPPGTLAAWLAGRADGAGLSVSPDGPLPTPPRWK